MFFPSFKISKILLYEKGQIVGEFARTAIANELEWTPGPVGETELTVVIEGQNGDKFISDPKRVKILPNAPPDLHLMSAGWPERQSGNDGLSLYMKLTDPDGKKGKKLTVKGIKVEVYNFDELVGMGVVVSNRGSNPNFPDFRFNWGKQQPAGTYSIRVVATDKDGYSTRLKLIEFTIAPPQ